MQFPDLLLFLVYCLLLLFCLGCYLAQLLLHPLLFVLGFFVVFVPDGLVLSLPDFFQCLFLLVQDLQLLLQMFELILLIDNLIEVILIIHILP